MSAPVRPSSCPTCRDGNEHRCVGCGRTDFMHINPAGWVCINPSCRYCAPEWRHDVVADPPPCELCGNTGMVIGIDMGRVQAHIGGPRPFFGPCPRGCVPVEPGATR